MTDMKTFTYPAIYLVTACTLITSCSNSNEIEDRIELLQESTIEAESLQTRAIIANDLTFEQVKTYLNQCGYDTTTLTEHEDYYLIDSDMGFNKERLAEAINQSATRMAYVKLLNKEYYRLNLRLTRLDFSVDQPFIEAVNEWNNIENCSINFASDLHYNTKKGRMDCQVYIQDDPLNGKYPNMIHVTMPIQGKPGEICINTKNKLWKKIDATQKKYAIMHALGHLVGCDHYDFWASQYPGTTSDPNSIMQNEQGLNENNTLWQGFTMWDIQALQTMYKLEPETYALVCQPEITGSDKSKMVVGTEYTLTASYDYDWVFKPTYSYEVIGAKDVVTYSVKNNALKLKFLKGGDCTVRVTAIDAYGEKKPDGSDYAFEVDYYAYPDRPTFTYPKSITLDTFYTFRMTFNNPDYKSVSYNYTVREELFDDNTDRSVDIEQDGKGTAKIRFNDFGRYIVTAEASYGGKNAKFVFGYTKLYRPEFTTALGLVEEGPDFNYTLPTYSTTPTGENLTGMYSASVKLGRDPLLPYRVSCDVQADVRQQCWNAPERVDYRILKIRELRHVILPKSAQPFVHLEPDSLYRHPDSINYMNHCTVIYPYAWVFYPENDRCALLKEI